MNRETLYISNDAQIKALEKKIDELYAIIEKFIAEKQSIGDWMNEKLTMNITGLGKTKLYELRNTGKVRSSSLTERKLFYRRSDLERLLNKNQK
ncbi:MAG: helix-turn-helix domain-containing protein [Bacteroidetes bacterium]|nr:helix-turn-helix domain-containing protein [Bacteroidota bacterium]